MRRISSLIGGYMALGDGSGGGDPSQLRGGIFSDWGVTHLLCFADLPRNRGGVEETEIRPSRDGSAGGDCDRRADRRTPQTSEEEVETWKARRKEN